MTLVITLCILLLFAILCSKLSAMMIGLKYCYQKSRPLNAALNVNLEQILVIPFEQKETSKSNVSVRFKVIRKKALNEDLKGERVSISRVLHFEKSRQEGFTAVLSVTDLYQNMKI